MSRVWDAKLSGVKLNRAQAAALRRINRELAALGPCLSGSVTVRQGTCGKPNCACHSDPPRLHGPYRSWTRKVAGKTVTRVLSQEQHEAYQPLFDNDRRLRSLLAELEQLGLEIIEGETTPTRR